MDATRKIQVGIHGLSLDHKSMCPGNWVHITVPIVSLFGEDKTGAVPLQHRAVAQAAVPLLQVRIVDPGDVKAVRGLLLRGQPHHFQPDSLSAVCRHRTDASRPADAEPAVDKAMVRESAKGVKKLGKKLKKKSGKKSKEKTEKTAKEKTEKEPEKEPEKAPEKETPDREDKGQAQP